MLFILKTVTDRVILSQFWTLWVLEILVIVPLKNVEFTEFRKLSRILAQIKNDIYLENF